MIRYFIIGGAGFIGSNLVKTILKEDREALVRIYDNFSSGRMWHLKDVKGNKRLKIIKGDIKDIEKLKNDIKASDVVYHLASNPDISRAIVQPDIDFWEGTYLTNNVLEVMRINRVKKILYSSGSGIYGDTGLVEIKEDYSPMLPISTYGASKLACEALISAYCYMFDISASVCRFANVVGPNQTHGVGYDFVKKLINNPDELTMLGDGKQSKSYIYITDVIRAMRLLGKEQNAGFTYYNVATTNYLSVREIADIVAEIMGLEGVKYSYTGGDRGWKGDVPIVRLNSEKIRRLGWTNRYTSREAMYKAVRSIYKDAKKKLLN